MAEDKPMSVGDIVFLSVVVIAMLTYYIGIPGYFLSRDDQGTSYEVDSRRRVPVTQPTLPRLTLAEAIETNWDEIQPYVSGVDEIEACNLENGTCYTLLADLISGHVDTIHFPDGGSLSFYTPIDELGTALEADFDGRLWEFRVDMNSSLVKIAVYEWAQVNGYRVGR